MAGALTSDFIGGLIGFLLTLMVLSYLIGDNPLFRVAIYIFVGVSAGYAAAVAWWQILWPRLFNPLIGGNPVDRILAFLALVLGVLLLMKISPRTSRLGGPAVAYLVGVAAAVAIGGAVLGTIIPQTQASFKIMDISHAGNDLAEVLITGIVMLIVTISTLAYFHFGARATPTGPQRNRFITILGWMGQVFIAITLGVLFAGVFSASLTALIERIGSISDFFIKIRALFL
jgi:predicted membrane protein